MGSYGIGPSRLMGVVVETLSDKKGIIWPQSIAPFRVHVLQIGDDESVKKAALKTYEMLEGVGVSVLYDDREDVSAGEKFADADLIGISQIAIISDALVQKGNKIELKQRATGSIEEVDMQELLQKIM